MDVDNFFYGMQAVLGSVIDTLRIASQYQLFLGFILGFIVASVIHAMLSAEHVRNVPSMVLSDSSVSFQKVHPPRNDGTFDHSYTSYKKNVDRMKMIFYGSGLLLIILIMLATLALK